MPAKLNGQFRSYVPLRLVGMFSRKLQLILLGLLTVATIAVMAVALSVSPGGPISFNMDFISKLAKRGD